MNVILLSIGYSKSNGDIYIKFGEMCRFFKNKGINIGLAESDVGNMHYIKCILKDTESDIKNFEECRDMFCIYCANIIYDFLSVEYEAGLLDNIISEKYSYLDERDLKEIKRRCGSVIEGSGTFTTEGLIYSISCKNNILKKLEEYLQDSNEIILDGFITFRLRNMKEELTTIIDKIVEEYVVEKEYSEFIKLLKYFVEIQDCKYNDINIFIQKDGSYRVEDENSKDITHEMFCDFTTDNMKGEINEHDILISTLITAAPHRVIIHNVENCVSADTIDTIKSIFLDKVTFCKGCEKCKPSSSIIKEKK